MRNHGNYIISLGNLCRWLADQALELGAEIFPGFAATEMLYDDDGRVKGVATGDMGVNAKGNRKATWQPGFEFHAKFTILAEGCRGHLGKEVIARYELDKDRDPQHYGIGIKEIWEISEAKHREGLVVHTAGWPMTGPSFAATSGGFLYHAENRQVYVGLIVDLGYQNPHISPFDEFQRYKHHPVIKRYLEGGKRISYGARAIIKGGINSLPEMTFPRRPADRLRRGHAQRRQDQRQPYRDQERRAGGGIPVCRPRRRRRRHRFQRTLPQLAPA